ncbi:Ger(x)C family spore germination protein [Neobacillus sp. SM06]|uniref:Ger(x)C family spore germination protein n=1 Tax=Neobacillus sp. SM06 TaxID=3422492 RepID=UPI003D27E5C5
MKKSLIWLVILNTFFLSGCWSRVEINDRLFVSGFFVDKTDDGKLELTLSFPLPNRLTSMNLGGSSPSGNPYTTVTKSGNNLAEIYRRIQVDLPRRISWGHTKVVVVGKEMAKQGIEPILEFTVRDPTFNIRTSILVAPGKAKNIAHLTPVFERFPSEVVREFTQKNNTLNTTVKDFVETENGDMIVGLLTIGKEKMVSEKGKKGIWVGTGGMALFKGFKMVGRLNQRKGRGALWLRNRMENAGVTLPSPTDQKPISLMVLKSNTKIRPSKNQLYSFDILVDAEDDVLESDSDMNLTDPRLIRLLEKKAEKEIKGRITEAFRVSQRKKADVFQLGSYLSWYQPKVWKVAKKNWASIYKEKVRLNIHVHLHIKRPGSEKNPFWLKGK